MPSKKSAPWERRRFFALATFILAAITLAVLFSARGDRKVAVEALEAAQTQAQISQEQADAAAQHAEIAEKTLAAQIQPVLVEVPLDLSIKHSVFFPTVPEPLDLPDGGIYAAADVPGVDGAEVRIAAPFLNAGRGIASVSAAWIEVPGVLQGFSAIDLLRPNVPIDRQTYALFLFRPEEAGFRDVGALIRTKSEFVVVIEYGDITKRQVTKTKLLVRYRSTAHTNWEVVNVEVSDPDTGEIPPAGAIRPTF